MLALSCVGQAFTITSMGQLQYHRILSWSLFVAAVASAQGAGCPRTSADPIQIQHIIVATPGHVIAVAVIMCRPYACRCRVMCSLEYPFMLRIQFFFRTSCCSCTFISACQSLQHHSPLYTFVPTLFNSRPATYIACAMCSRAPTTQLPVECLRTPSDIASLFQPLKLGAMHLTTRVVYAPLARCRALGSVPSCMARQYLSLIHISEPTRPY